MTNNPRLGNIAIVLLIVWAVGTITSYTFSGWIHLLLGFAIVAMITSIARRRYMSRADFEKRI